MKILSAVLLVAALASGCASHGTRFDMAEVDSFVPGVTTYDEVKARLGKPQAINEAADGSRSVYWMWAHASLLGAEHRATRIIFDRDGKLVRVATRIE